MKTEREVTENFVKAAHGFGAEARLDIGLAVGIRFESGKGNRGDTNADNVSCIVPVNFSEQGRISFPNHAIQDGNSK